MSAYNDAAFGSIQLFFGDQGGEAARRVTQYYSMPQDLKQWNDKVTVSRRCAFFYCPLLAFASKLTVRCCLSQCERIRILGVDTVVERTVHSDADLAQITVPVLLVHGSNDFVYPPSTAIELEKRLKDNGVEKVDLLIAKDAPQCVLSLPLLILEPVLVSLRD